MKILIALFIAFTLGIFFAMNQFILAPLELTEKDMGEIGMLVPQQWNLTEKEQNNWHSYIYNTTGKKLVVAFTEIGDKYEIDDYRDKLKNARVKTDLSFYSKDDGKSYLSLQIERLRRSSSQNCYSQRCLSGRQANTALQEHERKPFRRNRR